MRVAFSYPWWAALGAVLGGWMSAVLSGHILLTPDDMRRVTADGTGLAALATRAHQLVLAGLPMGAAAGLCLARYLHPRPVLRSKVTRGTVVLLLMGVALTGSPLAVFSGSVAALNVDSSGVRILIMEVFPPDHRPRVRVGEAFVACGPGNSTHLTSYSDHSAVVEVRHRIYYFPFRP